MATDLVWAAVDGPDGVEAVTMPEEREAALAMKLAHQGLFWCTTTARGCGARLEVVAGTVVRPYFRHERGSACAYRSEPGRAGKAYEHLRYQEALRGWLVDQGYSPTVEHSWGEDGRADLHVMVEAVSHSIEVQLSPLSVQAWQSRDGRYRRHAQHVTWLYGDGAEGAAAVELADRGVVLTLRPGPDVGVRNVADETAWSPLADCALTADGFQVPGRREALELASRRQAEREAAERRAAQDAVNRAEAAERARQEEEARRIRYAEQARHFAALPTRPVRTAGPVDLNHWASIYPEAAMWAPARGWHWIEDLPARLHAAAKAMTYTTQVLVSSSPTATVLAVVQDKEDRRAILDLLEAHGFITRYGAGSPPLERWRRCADR